MLKAKMKFVTEIEYEMNPEYYPEGSTAEEMLAIDMANAKDDPFLTLGDNANFTITGSVSA